MDGLEKATLTPLRNNRGSDPAADPIPVQFNPASLRLTLTNNTEGGNSRGRQARQYTGNSSAEISFDLVFDTADEGDESGAPRSVREKTNPVEQFVLPQRSGADRQSPPRARFAWGDLVVTGVITSLALDFDLFAGDGTPLRAKMSVTIKEQDPRFELLQAGAGASRAGGAPGPLQPTHGGVGAAGGGRRDPRSNRSIEALSGESAAELAARVGIDPSAWRGLAAGVESTLSLQAGATIEFDASLRVAGGVGIAAGVESGARSSLEAKLGLAVSGRGGGGAASAPDRNTEARDAGMAVSSAGGVGAAIETVRISRSGAAALASARAFGEATAASPAPLPGTPADGARSARPAGEGRGAGATEGRDGVSAASRPSSGSGSSPTIPSAAAPLRADPRASTFGFGVPLRPRVTGAAEVRSGPIVLRPYEPARTAPSVSDPGLPPWERRPMPTGPGQRVPSPATGERRAGRTGCGCGCGPRGGHR